MTMSYAQPIIFNGGKYDGLVIEQPADRPLPETVFALTLDDRFTLLNFPPEIDYEVYQSTLYFNVYEHQASVTV